MKSSCAIAESPYHTNSRVTLTSSDSDIKSIVDPPTKTACMLEAEC